MQVEIKNLSYIYNPKSPFEKRALDRIDLEIEEGDFFGIIGHTGSGKSTLVSHINALTRVQRKYNADATLKVCGIDLCAKKPDVKTLREKVGMVFQYPEYQLFADTVRQDVGYGPKNLGLGERETEERVRDAIERVGLDYDEVAERSPFELSGGQKRRVAIAGVIAMRPEVLILDEPTAGLDPQGRDEILGQIERLNREHGLTILVVSHSMEDMARYVDRIMVMNDGVKMFDDTPKEVFRHYKELEAIGLAAPQITYVVQGLRERGIPIDDAITTVEEAREAILALYNKRREKQ